MFTTWIDSGTTASPCMPHHLPHWIDGWSAPWPPRPCLGATAHRHSGWPTAMRDALRLPLLPRAHIHLVCSVSPPSAAPVSEWSMRDVCPSSACLQCGPCASDPPLAVAARRCPSPVHIHGLLESQREGLLPRLLHRPGRLPHQHVARPHSRMLLYESVVQSCSPVRQPVPRASILPLCLSPQVT